MSNKKLIASAKLSIKVKKLLDKVRWNLYNKATDILILCIIVLSQLQSFVPKNFASP